MCVIDYRTVAVLANMIVLSPYATQDLPIMVRHHAAYDHVGLAELADQATTSTNLPGVDLACNYVQEAMERLGEIGRDWVITSHANALRRPTL